MLVDEYGDDDFVDDDLLIMIIYDGVCIYICMCVCICTH